MKKTAADRVHVDEWIEETVSGTRSASDRAVGLLLSSMKAKDVLYVTEISRLGRSLMEIMSILHNCIDRDVRVFAMKEGYGLGHNISSKVLAFTFGLSAEIERNLISQRTTEALTQKSCKASNFIGRREAGTRPLSDPGKKMAQKN